MHFGKDEAQNKQHVHHRGLGLDYVNMCACFCVRVVLGRSSGPADW
jgi:hypothetical protein